MQKKESISVVIPAYNVGKYISDTVHSVLNQNYKKECIEVIVVNDGSTDNTLEILQEFSQLNQVSIIDVKNGGVSKARNLGIQQASGDFISFLDGDDTWHSDFLNEMVSFMNKNGLQSVSCLFNRIEDGIISYETKKIPEKKDLFKWYIGYQGMTINTNSWLINKEIISKNKLFFVEGSQFGEDTEFFTKVILHSNKENWGVLEKRLTNYIIRKESLTNPNGRLELLQIEMYFNAFRRTLNYMNNFELTKEEKIAFKNRVYLSYLAYLSSNLVNGETADYNKLKSNFNKDQQELNFNFILKMNSKEFLRLIIVKFDLIFLIFRKFKGILK